MKARKMDRDEATVPWFAARDAQLRSAVAATNYTDRQKARCEGIRFALEMAYRSREVYRNYRQRFVAIKVEHPSGQDRKLVQELEASWENNPEFSVDKIKTKQGLIYRVKFK